MVLAIRITSDVQSFPDTIGTVEVRIFVLCKHGFCLGDGSDRSLGAMSNTDHVNDWVRCWRGGLLEGLCWVENSCRDELSSRPPER